MVTATQLCFGLPLDPPPYDFLLIKSLSLIAPPEPPDPLHAVYLFAPLQAKPSQEFTQTLVPKLACPKMVTKLNGGGAPLVSAGDTPYAYGRLFHVVYMSHCGGADWFCLRSYLDLTFPPPTTVLQVHNCISLSAYLYSVEWVGLKIVWKALDMWSLVLVDKVLMNRFSISSTFVRSLSAVCRFFVASSLASGAVIVTFSSW